MLLWSYTKLIFQLIPCLSCCSTERYTFSIFLTNALSKGFTLRCFVSGLRNTTPACRDLPSRLRMDDMVTMF